MSRSVPLWSGKTDDAKIPDRVKLRIWEREGGRCWLTGRKIMPGDVYDFDHKTALCNGGTHSEDNLAPALRAAHRIKTAGDVKQKAKSARIRARHAGIKKPSRMAGSRDSNVRKRLDGTVVYRDSGLPVIGGR